MWSTNTLCFEGIGRVYRNSVVQHIRETFKKTFPDDWLTELKSPFQKEWASVKNDAEIRRQTGELGSQLVDEFDLLGVNHFYNLFDKYFSELFPCNPNTPLETKKQTKNAILSWARTIKNLRDPALGHPADADIDTKDTLMMLDSARRILDFIDPTAAKRIEDIWESVSVGDLQFAVETLPEQRLVEASTLPSRETIAPSFVGRRSELAILRKWLEDPHSRVWLLAGDGGKGKTAIAYEFAVSVCKESPQDLETVIWLSAKARRFESGQSVDIESPDFWDLNSALDCVLRAYGAIDFADNDLKAKSDECIEYLSQLPALVILDDVDSLEGQNVEAMNFFMERSQGTSSKVLLTTRRVPFGMEPRVTQVTGFESGSKDGIEFIDSRIELYGLDLSQFSRATKNNVLEACDGSPLFMQDLLRLCIVGETPNEAVRLWKDRLGDSARKYALGREFDMLSESAKRVLLTCALFPGPVSLPEIEVAADIPKDQCHSAILELHKLFLLPRPRFIEEAPRFGLNINTRQLVREVYGETDLARRISSSIKVILRQADTTPAHRDQIGQHIRQAVSFVKLDRHSEAESTLLHAQDLYPENADLHGSLGWVYKSWKPQTRYTDARRQFSRAADLKSSKEDAYRHWWGMEQAQHEWTSAAEAAERGRGILSSSQQLAFMAGLSRSQLAKDLYQQAQYSRAEQEAHKAQIHLRDALLDLDKVETGQYQFHSRVHRATVINYEHLVRISQSQGNSGGEGHFIRLLARSLRHWANEHPSDPNTFSEKQRLVYQFPSLGDYFQSELSEQRDT